MLLEDRFIGSNLVNFLIKNYFVINIDSLLILQIIKFTKIKVKKYKFLKLILLIKKLIYIIKKYKPVAIFNLGMTLQSDNQLINLTILLALIF